MTKPLPNNDFRATRYILEPDEFALSNDSPDPSTSDKIDSSTWSGIVDLPDDVAIRTSDHHGTNIRNLYTLWGDWLNSLGKLRNHDELFSCMLDASDCFQCATFELLHGFYRSSISNLRTGLELVMIGTFGNLYPTNINYIEWKNDSYELGYSYCRKKLEKKYENQKIEWMFKDGALLHLTYKELCKYTHSRPNASDAALWSSNGPIYDKDAFAKTYEFFLLVYSVAYLLVKVARPNFSKPKRCKILFKSQSDRLRAFNLLFN
ncbi:hypothetical protein [Legionella maceachernii]|uniref:Uncharacterized protein n=3 Tax=Legionella TaxID=445 RepID=A0A0W0W018_9GAMM|nr:hypothetical protein [Legionella maceachernii]KTD25765.1 hypothetical protein Lmac_1844 [Legionella maceachernii]SJZ91929.1 hypothetical protein SAMN02745128_01428 [Legionella maceachernii]SUP03602.1 Uncharacterised protein [Legionella maceachernii]